VSLNKNKIRNAEELPPDNSKKSQTSPKITKRIGKSTNVSDADRATAKNRKTTHKRPEQQEKIQKHETSGLCTRKKSRNMN